MVKIKKLDENIMWIIPIVKTKKRIYDLEQSNTSMYEDIETTTTGKILLDEMTAFDTVNKANAISNEENKYNYYYKIINKFYSPNIPISPNSYLEQSVNEWSNYRSLSHN